MSNLKKVIKEAVKEAIQEELKDILLEAVKTPKVITAAPPQQIKVEEQKVTPQQPQMSMEEKRQSYQNILGETQQDLDKGKDGFVGGSGDAYKKAYPKIASAILSGEKVKIKYSNINLEENKLSNKATEDVMLTGMVDRKMDKMLQEIKAIKSIVSKKIL